VFAFGIVVWETMFDRSWYREAKDMSDEEKWVPPLGAKDKSSGLHTQIDMLVQACCSMDWKARPKMDKVKQSLGDILRIKKRKCVIETDTSHKEPTWKKKTSPKGKKLEFKLLEGCHMSADFFTKK
jgi:hypothetical protein